MLKKGRSTWGRWSVYVQKVKRFLVQGYLDEEVFKGGAGLCRNNRCIQSIFNEELQEPQSSATAGHSWLLIQTVTWWGDFRQVGAYDVRSYPGLRHGKEISIIVRNKFFKISTYVKIPYSILSQSCGCYFRLSLAS